MTTRTISEQAEDAFLEDATNGWLDAADQHGIPHEMAEVMLLDEILRDFDMADPALLREYMLATLDALDAKRTQGEDSPAYCQACDRRKTHGMALIAAMGRMIEDSVTETTVITGARLQ